MPNPAKRFLLAAILACGQAAMAVAGTPTDPIMRPPVEHLSPALLRAKAELRDVVARRDMEALLARVRAETTLDFGGSEGRQGFQAIWDVDAESRQRLWATLEEILALPGVARRFDHGDEYCAPYVFCTNLPDNADPYEALVVLGSDVAIRSQPSLAGAVLRRVDHVVLARTDDDSRIPSTPDWTRVRLADGATGYISTRWVRSPIDFRLTLRVDDRADTWWLGFLVAGD